MAVAPSRHPLLATVVRRLAPGLAAVAVTLCYTRVCAALPTVPEDMKEVMQLDCTPSCLLCHTDEDGGKEDVNLYGEKVAGVAAENGVEKVFGANGSIVTMNIDNDMDGMNDRDEIIQNRDPRTEEEVGVCNDAVYGCGAAQMAPGGMPRSSAWALVAALGVVAFLLRQVRA